MLLGYTLAKLKRHINFLSEALQSEHCQSLQQLPPEKLAQEFERMLGKVLGE
jgi:hypothetical protein